MYLVQDPCLTSAFEKKCIEAGKRFLKINHYICLHQMLCNCQNVFSEKYLVPFYIAVYVDCDYSHV